MVSAQTRPLLLTSHMTQKRIADVCNFSLSPLHHVSKSMPGNLECTLEQTHQHLLYYMLTGL